MLSLNLVQRLGGSHVEVFPVGFKVVAERDEHWIVERGDAVPIRDSRRERGKQRRQPAKQYWLPHVETIAETLGDAWSEVDAPPSKRQQAACARYVLGRRMSKEGRF